MCWIWSGVESESRDCEIENMKPITWIGILLIVLGALALAYQGFTYTHRERVMEVGPMHVTKETQDKVPIPPILGGLVLVGGIALLALGGRKSS